MDGDPLGTADDFGVLAGKLACWVPYEPFDGSDPREPGIGEVGLDVEVRQGCVHQVPEVVGGLERELSGRLT